MSERFIARVVNVNDPELAGRVQIRVFGIHDDVGRIPDSSLPWARCVFPVTNPVHQGVAGATTGLIPGSTVVGYFADDASQIPLIDGTLGRVTDEESDFPRANRGDDFNSVLGRSLPSIGLSELRSLESRTIGSIRYTGQSITRLLTGIGEGGILSALSDLQNAMSIVDQARRIINTNPIGQLESALQGFISDFGSIVDVDPVSIITGGGGQIFNLANIPGTIGGVDLLDQINSATGVVFTTANHLTGSIGDRVSKRIIRSPRDALNRISGHRFVMNNTMRGIESSLTRIANIAPRRRGS